MEPFAARAPGSRQATPARPPRHRRPHHGRLGTSTATTSEIGTKAPGAPSAPDLHVGFPHVNLLPDVTERTHSLPANTLFHFPSSCRLRMIAAVEQCWQGVAQGSDEYSLLEGRRSKLLLAPVPPGLGAAAEVAKRLTLWEERRFEDLLRRAEEHLLLKQRGSRNDTLARADRARGTAAVGAYRKATTLLVSSMLSFEESDDLSWAKELLPTSSLGAQA